VPNLSAKPCLPAASASGATKTLALRLAFKFTLTMAAYDLIKLPRLIAVAA
jgi:hypothetical protein